MFEIEELFDLTIEGAFESPEDFNAFASQATPEELFSVMVEGAFESPEELLASFKKKDETDMDSVSGAGFSVLPAGEKDTWLERTFGKTHATDFFGDMYRSMQQGLAQGATVDDALKLFYSGKDVDEEDVRDYISAVQNMESFQPSDEMKEFDEIYQKEGGGIMGFIKGVYKNPTVIPQIFTSSMFAMANKGSLATGLGTGAAAGLATGGIGAIPGAIFGLSGALETGVSFTEFLKEELGDKAFTEENIKEVLEDQDALNKIRRRAGARGISIASIDALTAGVASKVGASVAKTAGKTAAGATRGVVEAVGGGVGEAAGRGLAGQEMDVAEIGFEAIGGTATAPLTIGGRVAETGMAYYKLPKYKIRNVDVTKEEFIKEIESATPEEILSMDTSVKNDEEVSGIMNKAWKDATIIKQTTEVSPNINEEELAEIVELTKRKELLEANGGEVAKAELPQVNNRIKEITNAIQERSTKTPPVPDQPKVGEEVGERDTAGEITGEVAPQEETVAPTDQEITEEADVTEVEIIYNLPKDPNEAVADFEILDNRNEKEGLEIYEDGSGKWYVRNKITGKIADAKSKKEAQELINNPDWDYGEGDIVQQVETSKEEKPTGFVTKPSIKEPFIVPTKRNTPSNTQINFTEDGKIESVVNKETGEPVSAKTRKVAEKLYLESLIDVNDGKFTEYQEGVTEERANQFVAENSQNVREIAEAIEREKNSMVNQRLEFDEADVLYDIDGYFTIEDIAEVWDERLINENSKSGRNIRRYWTRPSLDKFGRPNLGIAKIDTKAQELGISVEALKQIIIDYPTRNINRPEGFSRAVAKVGKTDALIDLENKFEKLTGLKATDTNINTVLDIDPNRPPLTEEQKLSLIEREQAIVESEGERVIKGKKVSAEQVVGGKPKEITVDEAKALKDQIKLEVRAAREAKADQSQRRKALSSAITNLVGQGLIKRAKANQLIKQISSVDLNKAVNVERVLAYIEKTFQEADYAAKLNEAEALRKKIKKLSKNKNIEVSSTEAAENFTAIDPVFVEDINTYIEQANKVKDGVTPSTRQKIMPALDIAETKKYVDAQKARQQEIELTAQRELFEDLTGLSPDELSFQEMREIVYGVEQEQPEAERASELERKAKAKAEIVRKGLNKAFDTVSTIVNELIETETDPFTGEKFSLTDAQKTLVKDFINIDINKLSEQDAIIALDSLINFATNKTTGGMGAIVQRDKGKLGVEAMKSLGIIAKPLSAILKSDAGIARKWAQYIATLPNQLELMFKGQSRARKFETLSGFADVKKGASEGESYAQRITNEYYEKFIKSSFLEPTKTQPNKQNFNTLYNDAERGMFAFVRRTVPGEEQIEFKRRKGLIEQTIDALKQRGGKEAQVAEVYEEVYNKILKDANSASEVESKVDPINIDAVNWMTDIWKDNYSQLSEVNLNIYNKILGKDKNYTPDSFIRLGDIETGFEIGEPIFDMVSKRISDKKTGVLMEVVRPSSLPKNRIINLSFDNQNINNLKKAKTEIETAGAIQQVKGFFESKEFEKIAPNQQDRELLKERVRQYIEAKKGREYIAKDDTALLKLINNYSGYAVSRTLGGVTQPLKQVLPVLVNTMMNVGPEVFFGELGVLSDVATDSAMARFVKNSGYPVSTRGLQSSTTLETNNKKLENAAKGAATKVVRGLRDLQRGWLDTFLVKPDRYVAQASWMMYYIKSLKEQGVDVQNINWDTHEVNRKAGDYAQQQVDRQQNVSDADLQGELFRSKRPFVQIIRRVLLPFSNFLLNQKTRMYSDITTLTSKTSESVDKQAALRSLSGLVAETVAFNALGLFISQVLSSLSSEDDEKEKKKRERFQNRLKGRAGQAVKDVLAPLPVPQVEGPLISGINALIEAASDSKEPFQFFELQPEDAWERMGIFSIPVDKYNEWTEIKNMALDGVYEKEGAFGKTSTKKIKKKYQEEMLANWLAYTLYASGLAPSEVGTVVRYNVKAIQNKSK
jgi:hypothetical protein